MKRALIEKATNRFVQSGERGQDFPVHDALEWRDCPDAVSPETHTFDGASFVEIPVPPPPDPAVVARLEVDEAERQACKVDAQILADLNRTPQEISDLIDSIFATWTAPQRTFMKRLTRIVVVAARRVLRNG